MAFYPGHMGRPAPELDFTGARDDGVAVASRGPYANHFHLAPDIVFSKRELTSVCRLSVCIVRPTQAVEIFGNISTAFGTLATP